MSHQVVTIGSALVDIFVQSDEFLLQPQADQGVLLCQQYGDKIEVDQFKVVSGGGGSNTAVGFARQGFSTTVMAEMGTDALAEHVKQELHAAGVTTNFMTQEKREETGISVILVAPDGGRTVLVHRGASSMLEEQDVDWAEVEAANWCHLTNSGGQLELVQRVLSMPSRTQTQVSWNPGKSDLKLLATNQLSIQRVTPTVLLLNDTEWQLITHLHQQLLDQIEYVVVTEGKRGGCVYHQGQEADRYQIEAVPTIEETGAGDAFAVGFVSGLLRSKEIKTAVELGKRNAASVVQHVGAKEGLLRVEKSS